MAAGHVDPFLFVWGAFSCLFLLFVYDVILTVFTTWKRIRVGYQTFERSDTVSSWPSRADTSDGELEMGLVKSQQQPQAIPDDDDSSCWTDPSSDDTLLLLPSTPQSDNKAHPRRLNALQQCYQLFISRWSTLQSCGSKQPLTEEDNRCLELLTPAHHSVQEDQPLFDLQEVYKLGRLALPLLLQYMIASSSEVITTAFVGHLPNPALLSSMVLATSLSCATGYTVMNGVASAIETLCGQAYGARNYKAMQDTLCRALLIALVTCVPVSMAWLHSKPILLALGQSEVIASGAARYLQMTIPALYLYSIHECIDKYLLSQRIVHPSLVITGITTALTPLFAWWFVMHQHYGLDGAAWAYVSLQALTTMLSLSYLAYRELYHLPNNPPPGWQPLRPSMGAFFNWMPYLRLAVPSVLSYCMEGWATEVLIFLSGMLDNAEVAVGVTGLALQFTTTVWLAAASIGSATCTRVANKLGCGDAMGANATARTAIFLVVASQTLIGVVAYIWREPLLGLMTSNQETIELAMAVMPVLACCFIADGLNVVQGAVLRGTGRQWWTVGLNVVGWWGVGVPLAYYLAMVNGSNVQGLWAGFATASALQSCLQYLAINKMLDWKVEVVRAQAAMEAEDGDGDDSQELIDQDDDSLPLAARSSAGSPLSVHGAAAFGSMWQHREGLVTASGRNFSGISQGSVTPRQHSIVVPGTFTPGKSSGLSPGIITPRISGVVLGPAAATNISSRLSHGNATTRRSHGTVTPRQLFQSIAHGPGLSPRKLSMALGNLSPRKSRPPSLDAPTANKAPPRISHLAPKDDSAHSRDAQAPQPQWMAIASPFQQPLH